MKGDFTRFSHQPHQHYAGVLMQQGRVTLDADWNEQFDIDDRRWRLQTIDTIGRACAPEDAPGFGLVPTPDGTDVVITPGRIYLDGILVEVPEGTAVGVTSVEGERATVRDLSPDGRAFAVGQWVEVSSADRDDVVLTRIVTVDAAPPSIEVVEDLNVFGDDDGVVVRRVLTYLTQPYFPAAAGSPLVEAFTPEDWVGQTHLVYLDVWRRHVTAIEDPYIREVALGGPDTATRVQTVWSVRILHDDRGPLDAAGLSCTSEIDAWDALVAPSAGRLSARSESAADPDSPCAIEPEAGYRGLENRLYRVEVHAPGPRGTATFKWSRDNGSVLSSIVDWHSADEIDVHSLGKDRVLRFGADDRVEVLSDDTEFAGVTGTMASIVGAPDEADRRITLDQDTTAHDGQRRPRVRRWDHDAPEPTTQPGWTDLELGVQVEFGEGPFEIGDYWVIPARVATGDVEGFVDAPPRGIEHHFARLGFVTWGPNGAVLDCRHRFTGLCEIEPGDGDHCCSVSVGEDGDVATLEEAIQFAHGVDGPVRICVLPGEHRLDATVVVDRGDLTISGCGRRSRLVALGESALRIDDVSDVRLEDLVIASGSRQATVQVVGSRLVEIIDCRITNRGRSREEPADDLRAPSGNPIEHHLVAPTTFDPSGPDEFAGTNFEPPRAVDSYAIDTGAARSLGPAIATSRSSMVHVNRCLLRGLPAVSAQGDEIVVDHNVMAGGGVWFRDGTEGAVLADNRISRGHSPGVLLGGLQSDEDPRDDRTGVRLVTIRANRIARMAREGIATPLADDDRLGEIESIVIEQNEIVECGIAPLVDRFAMGGGILLVHATDVSIHGNRVVGNGPQPGSNALFSIGFGIVCASSTHVDVSGNTVLDNGVPGGREGFTLNAGIVGLLVTGVETDDATRNVLVLDGHALRAHDNVVRVVDGPGVVAVAVGPVSVAENHIVTRYHGGTLDFGRAVLVFNMGATPDLFGSFAKLSTNLPNRLPHGRVRVAGNQITVQSDHLGLPVADVEPGAPIFEYRHGSSIAVYTFDDAAIDGNQVLHETLPIEGRRIRSNVWTAAVSARVGGNRITELARSTLNSYAGFALYHHVIDNITTHCILAQGPNPKVEHNTEILCPRFQPALFDQPTHYWFGD